MQKESQSVNVSKKIRTKPVRENKLAHWTDFEMRLKPVPLSKRRFYFEELFNYCELQDDEPQKFKRYSIERWAVKKRLDMMTIEKWAREDDYCNHLYILAKYSLGVRIEDGITDKEKSEKMLSYLHNYLPRKQKDDDREDTRKVKLANEGVTNGETKIIVVNENKKYEEPE